MSILWFEGFEHYLDSDQALEGVWAGIGRYDYNGITTERACTGRGSFVCSSQQQGLRRSVGGDRETVGVGLHVFHESFPQPGTSSVGATGANTVVLCQFRDASGRNTWSFCINPAGRLEVILGGNMDKYTLGWERPPVFARSSKEIAAGTWNHWEFKLKMHMTEGRIEVRLNGKTIYEYDGNTLTSTGEANTAEVAFGSFVLAGDANGKVFYDNIYCWTADDGVGVVDFLGMYEVHYLRPIRDEFNNGWELTSGANAYALVNEYVADDDNNYIFAESVDLEVRFEVEQLPPNVIDVAAVMPMARVRKTETGDCDIKLGTWQDDLELKGPDLAVTNSYTFQYTVQETAPDGVGVRPDALPFLTIERTL